jgi:glutamine synthetase
MHTHLSLWKGDVPLLAGNGYAGLSDLGLYAIGGVLRHARALCAFANATTNSYKRLIRGFEAPTKLSYSRRNRSAVIRIPVSSQSVRSRRIEYRCPDSASNPYLLFSAMLMAALDGIQTKANPGEPLDKDIYDLAPEELADVPPTPESLEASLDALRADHEFLLRGDVFTPDVIDTWIWYKRNHEIDSVRQRPHPYEFNLYYDV